MGWLNLHLERLFSISVFIIKRAGEIVAHQTQVRCVKKKHWVYLSRAIFKTDIKEMQLRLFIKSMSSCNLLEKGPKNRRKNILASVRDFRLADGLPSIGDISDMSQNVTRRIANRNERNLKVLLVLVPFYSLKILPWNTNVLSIRLFKTCSLLTSTCAAV